MRVHAYAYVRILICVCAYAVCTVNVYLSGSVHNCLIEFLLLSHWCICKTLRVQSKMCFVGVHLQYVSYMYMYVAAVLAIFVQNCSEVRLKVSKNWLSEILLSKFFVSHVCAIQKAQWCKKNRLRRNTPDVGVTSGQKSCTKIIYIVLQTSVGLF